MNTKATILTLVSVLALCGVGLADELYVPGQYATIQAAIDAAVDGDEVIVADGTYTGQGVSNNGIHFIDFRGKAITVKSQNGPENCVIDFTSAILDCGFMFYRQEGRDSVLDGLTLRGGYGAVNCADNSNPTIQNCVITGKTTEYGGGINCYDSSPLIINCTIRGNRAKERSGGGIHCRGQSSPVIENCTISKNAAPRGGGIYCNNEGFEDTGPLIINCTVTDNTAEYEDGGICTEYSSATIVNCIVSDNTGGHGGIGGIVCRSGGRTTISNSIISNNEGGGILCINSSVQISNCTITENLLGGVTCTDGDVTIANCMISGNIGSVSCARSGCIISNCELTGNRVRWDYGVVNCLYESEIMIRNCTIADNKAHRAGVIRDAGIRCSDGGSLTVTNSVLWSGSIENVGQGTYVTVTYSDIEGGYPGQGNIDVDPCFAFAGDYHLAPDSPCIDTGDTNYVPEPNEADLDGKVRISGSTIDMGAYEFGHEGALIAVSKKVVELFVREGQAHSSEEIIGIRNCGGAELRWKIVEDCRWLSVRPKMGSNLGEIDEVAFRASGTRLEHGDYTCMAEVVDRQALYSPRQVAVTLHVNRTQLVPEQYGTIQAAIDDSVNGDLVIVADGTYTGEGNRDIDFLGKAITVQSESGPDNCIIDCNGSEAEPHRGFYFLNVEDGNSILDGFTITNGYAATYVWYGSGGAICCYGSSPTIRNCVIANSSAARGGGVSCIGGRPTLTGCTISANKGRYSGGGVSMHGGRLVIANCLITGNIAEREAGGIRLSDASAVVSNCTIAENSAGKRGGAV
ncbi:MAG: right-handed parallel beta-helix repeat-containing protein, partial [Planctomycetota bacterium]